MNVNLPLPPPPKRSPDAELKRIAVHKNTHAVAKVLSDKLKQKLSDVYWLAITDCWLSRGLPLHDLHALMAHHCSYCDGLKPNQLKNAMIASNWDKLSDDEKLKKIKSETSLNPDVFETIDPITGLKPSQWERLAKEHQMSKETA